MSEYPKTINVNGQTVILMNASDEQGYRLVPMKPPAVGLYWQSVAQIEATRLREEEEAKASVQA